jgi:hypothetical protein
MYVPTGRKPPNGKEGNSWLNAKNAPLKILCGVNLKKATGIYLSLQQFQQSLLTRTSRFLLLTAAKKFTAKSATKVLCLIYNQEVGREKI